MQENFSPVGRVGAAVFEVVSAARRIDQRRARHRTAQREMMPKIKSPAELEMMKGLKRLFDPKGILNPGKVLPDEC